MRLGELLRSAILLLGALLCGFHGSSIFSQTPNSPSGAGAGAGKAAKPILTTTPARNGAVIVSMSSSTPDATILYTVDGSTPNAASASTITYEAPFLVASKQTVSALNARSLG